MSATQLGDALKLRNGQILPNRLMKSALSEALGDANCGPTLELSRLYARWAVGGYGLVVTGNVMVDRRHRGEPGNVVIEDERHLEDLRHWANSFRDVETPLWMQINHPGRQANALVGKNRPVAPSAIGARIPGAVKPVSSPTPRSARSSSAMPLRLLSLRPPASTASSSTVPTAI